MDIPHVLDMVHVLHASFSKGSSAYVYVNPEFGVYQRAARETSRHAFVETFELAALPGQVFTTFVELRTAALAVTPEMVESEKAKWPRLLSLEPVDPGRPYQNRCRLCPWVARDWTTDKVPHPETWRAHIAVDGIGSRDWFVGLCDEHKPLTRDPKELVARLQAEVDERKARGAFNLADLGKLPASDTLPF